MVGMVSQELPGDANSTAYASSRVHACDLLPSAAAGFLFAAKRLLLLVVSRTTASVSRTLEVPFS